jgi:hypothetical protein
MSRIKLTGALMAAVLVAAISGVGASAASAETFTLTTTKCTGGTFLNLCYETTGKEKLELTGKQTVAVTNTTTGVFKVPSLGIEILCATVTGAGTITQTSPLTEKGKIKGTLVFHCVLDTPAKCKIPAEKETLPLVGELISESELLLKPETGTTFIELPFENNGTETCPATIKGTHKITGEQVVKIINPGVAEETKEGESVEVSKLKFSEEAATLTGKLKLSFTGLSDLVYVSKEA